MAFDSGVVVSWPVSLVLKTSIGSLFGRELCESAVTPTPKCLCTERIEYDYRRKHAMFVPLVHGRGST